MKKVLPLIMLLSSSAAVMAQEGSEVTGIDVTNNSDSYTSVCVAATRSWDALDASLKENGFNPLEAREIACNGKPLEQFARESLRIKEATSGKLVLVKSDNTPETESCLSLLSTSYDPETETVPVEELRCNDLPLDQFMLRYGRKEIVEIL